MSEANFKEELHKSTRTLNSSIIDYEVKRYGSSSKQSPPTNNIDFYVREGMTYVNSPIGENLEYYYGSSLPDKDSKWIENPNPNSTFEWPKQSIQGVYYMCIRYKSINGLPPSDYIYTLVTHTGSYVYGQDEPLLD